MSDSIYDHKYLRDWAKKAGIPMPRHLMICPLERGGEGAYYVLSFDIREGYKERADYLQQLAAEIRRAGYYARIKDHRITNTSLLIDFVGKIAELDIETQVSAITRKDN